MEENQEKPKKENRIKCNNCNSGSGYLRVKDKEWVCRSCGHIQKIEGEKEDGGSTTS